MMLAWKMAACLAAGNTVVLKPAQVTPLTSLKFCELAVKAGFPPGVINVVSGGGRDLTLSSYLVHDLVFVYDTTVHRHHWHLKKEVHIRVSIYSAK